MSGANNNGVRLTSGSGLRRRARTSGFSLIELVIVVVIIAIIGAIAIPKMSRGAAGAGDAAVLQNLSTMRSGIELYQSEHGGTYPSNASVGTFLSQLTTYTDASGGTAANKDATHIYGPYLKAIPPLPVGTNKGLTTMTVTGPAGTGAFGWYYDGNSVYANDPITDVDVRGIAYSAY